MNLTKKCIFHKARELFACKQNMNVSVREIAEKAGVNIAAINYHFGSKEELISAIIRSGFEEMIASVSHYISTTPEVSFKQLSLKILELLQDKKDQILASYRLLMIADKKDLKEIWLGKPPELPFGLSLFRQILKKECTAEISEADVVWATHIITVQILQLSLMEETGHAEVSKISTAFGKNYSSEIISRLADSIIQTIQQTRSHT